MFLTSHVLIGLSSTKFINDPTSLFFINFFLHYVFDAIPHGKENGITKGFKDLNKNIVILAFLDIVTVLIITILFYKNLDTSIYKIIPAVIGQILPDFLWGFYRIWNLKFFKFFSDINHLAHQIFDIEQKSILFYTTQIIPIIIFFITFYFLN